MASRVKLFGKSAPRGPRIKKLAPTVLDAKPLPSADTLEAFGFVRKSGPTTFPVAEKPSFKPKIARVARPAQAIAVRPAAAANPISKKATSRKTTKKRGFSRLLDDDTEDGVDLLDDDFEDDEEDDEVDDGYASSMIDDEECDDATSESLRGVDEHASVFADNE